MKRRAKVPPNRFLWPNTGTGSAFTFANFSVGNRMGKKLPPEKGELLQEQLCCARTAQLLFCVSNPSLAASLSLMVPTKSDHEF